MEHAEPNFEELLATAAEEARADSAVDEPAADIESWVDAVFGVEVDAPVGEDAPDEEVAAEPDGEDVAETEGDEEPEDVEATLARLQAQVEEYEQAKREAEAELDRERVTNEWKSDRERVDGRLMQALEWLQQESDGRYDGRDWLLGQLPTVIEGYTRELTQHFQKREQAWEQVARAHGTRTYVQELQARYVLSDADLAKVKKYPPEFMEQAARDIVEARGEAVAPVKRELTTTKSNLTKAQTALKKSLRAEQIGPGGVSRPSGVSVTDITRRITPDNADEIAGSLFAAIGLTP